MVRLLAAVALSLLLLAGGAQALVLDAFTVEACDGHACCCVSTEEASDGPAFSRGCCCEVEPQREQEPAPEPVFDQGERVSVPDLAPAPADLMPGALPALTAGLLTGRPAEPRAPPGDLLRLHCVLRC